MVGAWRRFPLRGCKVMDRLPEEQCSCLFRVSRVTQCSDPPREGTPPTIYTILLNILFVNYFIDFLLYIYHSSLLNLVLYQPPTTPVSTIGLWLRSHHNVWHDSVPKPSIRSLRVFYSGDGDQGRRRRQCWSTLRGHIH